MEEVLSGRTVLVTGGSMGIGYACAERALASGARVAIAARTPEPLESARRALVAASSEDRVRAYVCDVAEETDVADLVSRVEAEFGGLDGVVHAAAVIGPIDSVVNCNANGWLAAVRTDLFGSFLVARACARVMLRRGGGRIVLMSGGGATSPFPNYSAYACSKAGVVRLVETLAVELSEQGIEVNALAPGFVATRIHEATLAAGDRAGADYAQRTKQQLEEGGVPASVAAAAAVFLLSDASRGITGRLLAAPWDDWASWPDHRDEIIASDAFTLRRIVPRDRGMTWQ